MTDSKIGTFVNVGGKMVDANSGLVEAVANPSEGYLSRRTFQAADMRARLSRIAWFSQCGTQSPLELSCSTSTVVDWTEAVEASESPSWENAQLEAANQLTLWLHRHASSRYQDWNEVTRRHKEELITPLVEQRLSDLGARATVRASVTWDILAALMEDSYIDTGHSSFFFLELFEVYEAGRFPCGWRGAWPKGALLVY
jgi:hypothetical protein